MLGFNKRTFKVIGETNPQKCRKCSHERPFKMVEEKTWFTLLFIPLFPYKTRKLLVCQVCGAGYEAEGDMKVTEVEPMDKNLKSTEKETAYNLIKEKFDKGEISKNEYIRMKNIVLFDRQYSG